MRKQLLSRGVWYIGRKCRERTQKGFFAGGSIIWIFSWATARLSCATDLKKKYLVVEDDTDADMPKQKILLRRRTTPQRVRLPNGQSFLASYERASGRNLPRNVKITRTRQTGPGNLRKQRAHRGGSLFGTIAKLSTKALTSTGILKKGMGVGVRTLNSEIGKKNGRRRNKTCTRAIQARNIEIKNQSVKNALESDVANYVVQEAQKKAVENLFG